MSGIADTLRNAKEAITGLARFVEHITHIADTISGIIGIQVLLLLIVISIIASGLAAVGIPRGKISFFFSLVLADFLWILWSVSFSPGSYAFIYSIAKTNLILLSPYILILIIKRYWPNIRSLTLSMKRRLRGYSPGTLAAREFMDWKQQYQSRHNTLLSSLDSDLYRGKDGIVEISEETIKALDHIKESIEGIKNKH